MIFRQYYPEGGWGHLVLLAVLATTALSATVTPYIPTTGVLT